MQNPRKAARPARRSRSSAHGGGGRDGTAPAGKCWLFGTHAVAAALANPRRVYERLLVTEAEHPVLEEAARTGGRGLQVNPELVQRARLDDLLGPEAVHQAWPCWRRFCLALAGGGAGTPRPRAGA